MAPLCSIAETWTTAIAIPVGVSSPSLTGAFCCSDAVGFGRLKPLLIAGAAAVAALATMLLRGRTGRVLDTASNRSSPLMSLCVLVYCRRGSCRGRRHTGSIGGSEGFALLRLAFDARGGGGKGNRSVNSFRPWVGLL